MQQQLLLLLWPWQQIRCMEIPCCGEPLSLLPCLRLPRPYSCCLLHRCHAYPPGPQPPLLLLLLLLLLLVLLLLLQQVRIHQLIEMSLCPFLC